MSGTKTDLIERLKPFQDTPTPTTALTAIPMEISRTNTTAPTIILPSQQAPPPETMTPTPPVSPLAGDSAPQDVGMSDALEQMRPREEKDRRLHEKERQIEELMRKLEHEQKLVEELKMQLQVEKRGGPNTEPGVKQETSNIFPNCTTLPNSILSSQLAPAVKKEGAILPNCLSTTTTVQNSILGSRMTSPLPTMVKLEDVTVSSANPLQIQAPAQIMTTQRSPKLQTRPLVQQTGPGLQQFFISHTGGVSQVLGQPPQTLLTTAGQGTAQILVPVSLPSNTIQLPSTTVSLQVQYTSF